jgi:hypothetical protein
MAKQLKKIFQGAVAATAAVMAIGASAQNVQVPAGLQWQQMHIIWFNATVFSSTGTPEEKELLGKIWAKEISGSMKNQNGSLFPSSALIGNIAQNGIKIIFTMYNRAGSDCMQPGNGQDMDDMYATCPLRVIRQSGNDKPIVVDLPVNFCMLDVDDEHNPRSKNHNEYALDTRAGVLYLRTIQYGKVVPACNRALQVFKV